MKETNGQYWGTGIYGLRCNSKTFYIDLPVKKGNLS